jgi:hypothetical protein
MVTMAFPDQACTRESAKRKLWTAESWRAFLVFLAQSLGLVCAAALLYPLGPALGVTLIVAGLAVWSQIRKAK